MLRERDNSEITTFLMCPRAHDYAYHRLLKPVRPKLILNVGITAHSAGALVMVGQDWRSLIDEWRDQTSASLDVGSEGPEPTYGLEEVTQAHSNLCHGLRAFEEWWAKQSVEVLGIEVPFSWTVPGTHTRLIGKVDAILRISGQTWIQEFKTSARKWTAQEVAINRQFASYCCALRSQYPDLVGVRLVNILMRTPKVAINKPTKEHEKGVPSVAKTQSTDRETYLAAMDACGVESDEHSAFLATLPSRVEYHIQEDPTTFSVDALANFITEDLRDAVRLMDRARNEHFRVRSPGLFAMNCASCAYQRICGAELHGWDVSDLTALGYETVADGHYYLRTDVE